MEEQKLTVSKKLDQFIENNGGNERDALNILFSKFERIQSFLQGIPKDQLNLIIESNEYHITKDVYNAAETGYVFAQEIIASLIE